MTAVIRENPSPNFDERAGPVRYVILHYTGMKSAPEALKRMCDPAAKVSAHYMIERDGIVWRLVAEDKRAWHAGKSYWRGETDINSVSVGIELVNRGHEWGYQSFSPEQIDACRDLLREIMKRHDIPAQNILAHSDVAPQRKEDPGERFPWQELAADGIGIWREPGPEHAGAMDSAEARRCLRAIGYDCAETGDHDRDLHRVLLAFQRHWRPGSLTGLADEETAARLRVCRTIFGETP